MNLIYSNSVNTRNYSVQSRRRFRRNEGSDEDSDYGPVKEPAKPFAKNLGGNCEDLNSSSVKRLVQRRRFCSDDYLGLDFEGEPATYSAGNCGEG